MWTFHPPIQSHSPPFRLPESSDLIPTLMLRQDRQSGTITRKQEEEGGQAREEGSKQEQRAFQCYTEGKWALKVGPSDPVGPFSHHTREERRQGEREKGVEKMCVLSLSAPSVQLFLSGSFQVFRMAERRICYWQFNNFGHVK